jgi:glycosidase
MMAKWICIKRTNDFFNLDNIAHIWLEKGVNGYFLMGEMMHNEEEVVLTDNFETPEECTKHFYKMKNIG